MLYFLIGLASLGQMLEGLDLSKIKGFLGGSDGSDDLAAVK